MKRIIITICVFVIVSVGIPLVTKDDIGGNPKVIACAKENFAIDVDNTLIRLILFKSAWKESTPQNSLVRGHSFFGIPLVNYQIDCHLNPDGTVTARGSTVNYLFNDTEEMTNRFNDANNANQNDAPVEETPSTPFCTLSNGTVIYDQTRCEPTKTYKSDKLKIEFQVHQNTQIIEQANRIYVGGLEGQYVDLINKPAQLAFIDKVKQLNGPTNKNCRVFSDLSDFETTNSEEDYFPDSYETITVQADELDFDRSVEGKPLLCQSKYAGLNGMTLFLADKNTPDKIAYFSIGQYSIPAGGELDWWSTFRFNK